MSVTELSWIEVDAVALRHNIEAITARLAPGCRMVPVLKANAYGHGYLKVGRLVDSGGFPFFAVHNLEEAFILRDGGLRTEILIMGYVPLADLKETVAAGFNLVIYNQETLAKLTEITGPDRKARCHLKIETGTQRQGIRREQVPQFLEIFKQHPQLELRGLCSHFANIEDTTDHSYAESQLQRLEAGFEVPFIHMASSAASLLFPKTHFNLARVGISLYGLWPSKQTYLSYLMSGKENQILQPVLSWKSIIAQIKDVKRGEYVGYGTTYRATADIKLAVVPIGYYDGYDRALSNRG
jgi:alanine racemase